MNKGLFTTIGIFIVLLFLLGSCQPNVNFSWRMLGWRCQSGI